ncbi:hypothetical protein LWC33_27245 [Pseudonocardia sp. RS11V-5]|uniref:hypothetical protein n=1 Tax=Pseudonocardia terrae TaxID=2905831 RepID=UPI001E52B1C1|nr:hypothetical protein [Pseudonocardia terrae]MCE3555138.1 hypothetical protein [Pseudonocardia terrae]
MARRIGGKGGGSDKGSGGDTPLAIALGIALLASAGGATAIGSATSSGGASISAGGSSGARSGSRVSSKNSTAAEARIVRQGVRLSGKVTDDSAACAANSYGQVQDFFRRTPCAALHRAYFELRDRKGDAAIVAVSWVEMPDEPSARALKQLMDTSGTGNVTELSRERGKYRTIRYIGDAYASRRDGPVVINAQVEPVARGWAGRALTSIATNAAQ